MIQMVAMNATYAATSTAPSIRVTVPSHVNAAARSYQQGCSTELGRPSPSALSRHELLGRGTPPRSVTSWLALLVAAAISTGRTRPRGAHDSGVLGRAEPPECPSGGRGVGGERALRQESASQVVVEPDLNAPWQSRLVGSALMRRC